MLHQTLPLFFHFNPFSSSSPTLPSHSLSQIQVKQEMDCVETKAFKTSFLPEAAMKSTQEAFFEDIWAENGTNVGVSGDDFFVDNLLDFSKVEGFVTEQEQKQEEKEDEEEENNSNSSGISLNEDFGSIPCNEELNVPADELENLEWLSHFVENCFSEISPTYPIEKTQSPNQNRSEPETETPLKTRTFPTPVPAKARSKRSRTGVRVWSLGSPSFTETQTSSSSSDSSSSSPTTSPLIFTNTPQNLDLFYCLGKPPAKKQKKKPGLVTGSSQTQRRCSHCGVQKTPQWRTGPLGAKTLCNACGVRHKSGRLLPEYRPACSPTFSSEVHSNSHRKVLEMRRKKEMTRPESRLVPAVQSF